MVVLITINGVTKLVTCRRTEDKKPRFTLAEWEHLLREEFGCLPGACVQYPLGYCIITN